MFKRVCTFRQIVLLFNYHIITHAAYLDEKKFQQRPKFQNCVKDLWYWFAMRFPMLELTWTFKKKFLKRWRTLFRVDISSTFCWFELMSGRTNVLTPPKNGQTWIYSLVWGQSDFRFQRNKPLKICAANLPPPPPD